MHVLSKQNDTESSMKPLISSYISMDMRLALTLDPAIILSLKSKRMQSSLQSTVKPN